MDYKPAKIYYGAKGRKDITKPWFVFYSVRDPITEKFVRFKEKAEINRLHLVKEREAEAIHLRDTINYKLRVEKWTPFPEYDQQDKNELTFIQALDFALEIKKLYKALKSYQSYLSRIKVARPTIKHLGIDIIPVKDIRRSHILSILNEEVRKGASKHKRNSLMEAFRNLFTTLVDEEKIPANPLLGMKTEPLPETEGFKSYQHLRAKIKQLVYNHSFAFGLLNEIVYTTGMRINEAQGLQWSRIDFLKCKITLLPEVMLQNKQLPEKITKTLKIRHLFVDPDLIAMLKKHYDLCCEALNLPEIPDNWFLFSKRHTFLPGETRLHRNQATATFAKIRKDNKLPPEVKMYGWKATRADDLIDAGVPLENIKEMYGHHSIIMTRAYAKKMAEKSAQIIKERGPKF